MTVGFVFQTTESNPEPHFVFKDFVYFAKDFNLSEDVPVGRMCYAPECFFKLVKRNSFVDPNYAVRVVNKETHTVLFPTHNGRNVSSIEAKHHYFEKKIEKQEDISYLPEAISFWLDEEIKKIDGVTFDKPLSYKKDIFDNYKGAVIVRVTLSTEQGFGFIFTVAEVRIMCYETGIHSDVQLSSCADTTGSISKEIPWTPVPKPKKKPKWLKRMTR